MNPSRASSRSRSRCSRLFAALALALALARSGAASPPPSPSSSPPPSPSSPPPRFELVSADAAPVVGEAQGVAEGVLHGFEGGLYFAEPGDAGGLVRHLFPSECMNDTAGLPWDAHMRGGHFRSADGGQSWARVGTTYDSSAACSPDGADRCASMWAPMPVYDEGAGVYRLFVVCYRVGVRPACGQTDGEIVMRTSAAPGRAGLDGPFPVNSSQVVLNAQGVGGPPAAYEGSGAAGTLAQGTDSFFPYQLADGSWAAFFGSHDRNATPSQWRVGLATAPALAGPWARSYARNPVALEPEGKQATENPIVIKTQDGAWFVAVWDALRPPVANQIGISYSADGLAWSTAQYVPVWPSAGEGPCGAIRTPLGLVAEPSLGAGLYSVLFSGNAAGYESVCRAVLRNAAEAGTAPPTAPAAAAAAAAAVCPASSLLVLAPASGAFVCVDGASGELVAAGGPAAQLALAGGGTELLGEQCAWQALAGASVARASDGVSVAVRRDFACAAAAATASVEELFSPGSGGGGGSVRWTARISSNASSPLGVRVRTRLAFAGGADAVPSFWLAQNSEPVSSTSDPLAWLPTPTAGAQPLRWTYGGVTMTWAPLYAANATNRSFPSHEFGAAAPAPGFSLPLLALSPGAGGGSLAFVGDLGDATTYMNASLGAATAEVAGGGGGGGGGGGSGGGGGALELAFDRYFVRVGGNATPLEFAQDLVVGPEDDWRPALAWAVATYPEHLQRRAGVDSSIVDGLVAYADFRGKTPGFNASFLKEIGFVLNWDATFPQMYHGDDLPQNSTDGGTGEWFWSCMPHTDPRPPPACQNLTYEEVAGWYAELKAEGFATATYGNFFEYGLNILNLDEPLPAACAAPGPSPVTDPEGYAACRTNTLVRGEFVSAAVRDTADPTRQRLVYSGNFNSTGCDPGDDAWRAHLVQMYGFVLDATPAQGLAVDRGDWAALFNVARDDGVSFFAGAVAASLLQGYMLAARDVGAIYHARGLPVVANLHPFRGDLARSLDGIFDEYGDTGSRRTADSWLCSGGKVCAAWNHGGTPAVGWDLFLQQHLYSGVWPMAPFANNDHALQPGGKGDAFFLAYGALFLAMHGDRAMDLRARPVAVLNVTAGALPLANLFAAGGGRTAILVLVQPGGGGGASAVELRYGVAGTGAVAATAFLPGGPRGGEPVAVQGSAGGGALALAVPLARGCAVVVVRSAAAAE